MKNAIRVVSLGKQFGSIWAIKGVSFEVPTGSVFGFLGPNGAGKTTTIRCMMNFIAPTKGIATILDLDSQDNANSIHRNIGYLTGEMEYYDNLTGRQYITYMGNIQGKLDIKTVNSIAKKLKAQLHVKIKNLSRGNRQKIGLISALQHDPDLLVFDEPTTGLDPIIQLEFRKLIAEHKAKGKTVFISSHFLTEVEQICDMVAFINKGHLQEVLTLDKLRERSLHEFDVQFRIPASKSMLRGVRGVKEVSIDGNNLHCHVAGHVDSFIKAVAHYPIHSFQTRELDLEEVFYKMYQIRGRN